MSRSPFRSLRLLRIDSTVPLYAAGVNEIELARLADKVEAVATDEGWTGPLPMLYVEVGIESREADLVNSELARRGVDATVMAGVRSFEISFSLDSSPG